MLQLLYSHWGKKNKKNWTFPLVVIIDRLSICCSLVDLVQYVLLKVTWEFSNPGHQPTQQHLVSNCALLAERKSNAARMLRRKETPL